VLPRQGWHPQYLALLLALVVLPWPAAAQNAALPDQAAVSRHNLAEGKPAVLNGIRETMLPNGLTVLTKEVHAAPVVFFSVYYRVGSVNEEVGETGMSHLMEHMMFKGTHKRGPGVISAALQANGANFNASTWLDRTEYHETLASDRLELAMQIESDRMVNSVFDEAQHQKEMTVVRSEYEAGENNPGTVLDKATRLAAYQIHPYRWPTIGFRADIEHFTRDEMLAYYHNFYTPNNAVVVIVGDFDTDRALALVRRYFGPIKPHPVQQHFITPEPAQEGERRVIVRRAGTLPQVEIAYHIPGFGHPDHYALDVLETVLSGGRTGRFFQDLVQTGIASGADAYDYGLRYPDLFTLRATAQPGHSNVDVEKALLAEIDKVQAEPISGGELARALREAEADYIFGKDSVQQQGQQLGENAMRGDWRFGETYIQNLRKVTTADVQRVARKYLIERNRTVGWFEPLAGAGPGVPAGQGGGGGPTPEPARLIPERPLTEMPGAGAVPGQAGGSAQSTRLPSRFVLPNGLTVIVQENHANSTVSFSGAMLSAGALFDPPGQRGLASFTASQLSRGTQTRSLMDIARSLEGVGASVNIGAGDEYLTMGGRSLSRDFGLTMQILADELRNPSFPQDQMEKSRKQELAGIDEERQSTRALADIAFANALYPAGHPYSQPTLDEQAGVIRSLTRDDLVSFHDAHYAPDQMTLSVVGDVTPAEVLTTVRKYFGDWERKGGLPAIQIPDVPLPSGPEKTIVIQVPDKAQVDVAYGYPGGLKRNDPDFYRVMVLDTILGGGTGLASRLGVSVRDHLGLVYGIYAYDAASLGAGPFQVAFGANPANVDRAIDEMNRQLGLLRDKGPSADEVHKAISYLTGSYPVTLSTNGAVAGQLLGAQIYHLGLDFIRKRNSYYEAVTPAQVIAAARKYLHTGIGALVIAGTYSGRWK
jgi:zinc protease